MIKTINIVLAMVPIVVCGLFAALVGSDPSFRMAAATVGAVFLAAALAVWFGAPTGYLAACWGLWIGIMAMLLTVFSGESSGGRGEWFVPAAIASLAVLGVVGVILSLVAQRR
jgi:hypothetical protein